jgi:hypothetical protein
MTARAAPNGRWVCGRCARAGRPIRRRRKRSSSRPPRSSRTRGRSTSSSASRRGSRTTPWLTGQRSDRRGRDILRGPRSGRRRGRDRCSRRTLVRSVRHPSRRRSIHHPAGDLFSEITSEGRQERWLKWAQPRTGSATAGATRRRTTTPQPGLALIVGPSPPTPPTSDGPTIHSIKVMHWLCRRGTVDGWG